MLPRHWKCLCGGRAWTRDELIAAAEPDYEKIGWADYWRSMLAPDDFYCSDEDDVLYDECGGWEVRGLYVPVHDGPEPMPAFEELVW